MVASRRLQASPQEKDMTRVPIQWLTRFALAFLFITLAPVIVKAQAGVNSQAGLNSPEGLQTINNPDGGQIVYGPLKNQASLAGALGIVLRQVHAHFGDRPQIGRLFRAKNSDSVATFFTVTPKAESAKRIAGLVIVCKPAGAKPAAALVYDDADRFGKTLHGMLKTLNEAWKPDAAAQGSAPSSPQDEVASVPEGEALPLHTTPFPDQSGSIGLPDGWHITLAARGGVHAAGPNGEQIHLGVIISGIYDTTNPRVQAGLPYLSRSGRPYLAAPYGGDLVEAYRAIAQQLHRRTNTPAPTLTVTSNQPLPASPIGGPSALIMGELDNHDGTGPQTVSMRLGTLRPGALGQWALCINAVTVPKPHAAQEWATMRAIVSSWRQDGAVIQHQTDVEIGRIHRIGDEVNARIARQHAANDAHNAAVYKQWDNQEKYSKSFQNYLLDQAVIQDNESGGHATTDYRSAAAMVQSDPNRYQYVNTPDFLKGIDY
jgi:hypothetical protein